MNATTFKRANRFSPRTSIADAAVAWEKLSEEQQSLVIVKSGIPYLAGVEALTERAEALLEAAQRGEIEGLTHNEDGYPLSPPHMQLERASVQAWIEARENALGVASKTAPRATTEQPARVAPVDMLVKESDALKILGIGRTTFYDRIKKGKIEDAHEVGPRRWRLSYLQSLVSGGSGSAKGDSSRKATHRDEDGI